jgi:hypothetical protein
MNEELRSDQRRELIAREEWITKFVNAIVRGLRPGLERMVAVKAAREAWPNDQALPPRDAAQAWVERTFGGE